MEKGKIQLFYSAKDPLTLFKSKEHSKEYHKAVALHYRILSIIIAPLTAIQTLSLLQYLEEVLAWLAKHINYINANP